MASSAIETAHDHAKTSLGGAEGSFDVSLGTARATSERLTDRMGVLAEVRLIGGALIFLLLMVFVLTEIYNAVEFETDTEGEYVGPFGEVVESLTSIGPTALTLLVLALLVIAASAIMRFFGSGGFGSR